MKRVPRRPIRENRYFADVLSFGWVLPSAIAAGAGLGWVLDRVFKIFPVLTIIFGFLGFAAGLRQILKEAEALAGDAEEGRQEGDRSEGDPKP